MQLQSGYALPALHPKSASHQPRKPGSNPLIFRAELFRQPEPPLYEVSTEPLSRIFGVLGNWCDGDDVGVATRIIRKLAVPEVANGGSSIWWALSAYPAVLLTYSVGIGQLRAGQLGSLATLLSSNLKSPFRNETKVLVQWIFLEEWGAGTAQLWWELPEFKLTKSSIPLSTHLHGLFRRWARDYVLIDDELDELFGEFELLCSLLVLWHTADKPTLQQVVEGKDQVTWVPIGQLAWNLDLRASILDRWSREPYQSALYRAGFVPDVETLNLCVEILRRHFQRMKRQWS